MKKEEELIMVIKKGKLFQKDYFEGFSLSNEVDFKSRILEGFEYLKRKDVENNEDYKQPISYVVLINENKSVFVYQRAEKDKDYTEKRLQGKWSIGIGGHIDKEDEIAKDPIKSSVLREIEEEVTAEIKDLKLFGYINDDSNSVGKVHFGLLYIAKVFGDVNPKDSEIRTSEMMEIEYLKNIEMEVWSKVSLKALGELL
jgi:predicted NUDIX family phosphoesterase